MSMASIGRIRITRYETGKFGTFGVLQFPEFVGEAPPRLGIPELLSLPSEKALHTLEPPIDIRVAGGKFPALPGGAYPSVPYMSFRFGPTWILLKTEPRTGILFHAGNTWLRLDNGARVTRGCILLGLSRGLLDGVPAILRSREALRRFLDRVRLYKMLEVEIENETQEIEENHV